MRFYQKENKNKKINIENEELKIELENYKKKLESSLQLLKDKDNLIIKLQKITKEKTQNESKESFSDITTDDKSIKIYKKKSLSDLKFSIEKKNKQIEEIKLKIPLPKTKIQEIQIKKNFEYHNNKNYSDDNLKIYSERNYKEYLFSNPDIENILSKTNNFENEINYDSFNFIINPKQRKLFSINSDSNFTEYDIQKNIFSKHNLGEMKIYHSYDKEFQSEGTIILKNLIILTVNFYITVRNVPTSPLKFF